MSKETGQVSWIDYAILGLIIICLIVSAVSLVTVPEVPVPENIATKDDVARLATKSDVTGLATKDDVTGLKSDVSGLKEDVSALKEAVDKLAGPMPTPPMTVYSVFLWEKGESRLVAGPDTPLTNLIFNTLNRVNLRVSCVLSEERVKDVKENDKVVELSFRFYENIPPLGDVKYALFILEDNLAEGLEGHILVYSVMPEDWSCWAIQQEGSDELDVSWIEEVIEEMWIQ